MKWKDGGRLLAPFTSPTAASRPRPMFTSPLLHLQNSTTSNGRVAVRSTQIPHQQQKPQEEAESNRVSLVIFDKDGTLICFHSMWVPWAREVARKLSAMARLPDLTAKVFQCLGFCPVKQKVRTGLLAEGTMGEIRQRMVDLLHEEGVSVADAERIVRSCVPDCNTSSPATLKQIHDLKRMFGELRTLQVKVAICTADSRLGTINALRSLGLEQLVDAVVCGDDSGSQPKPHPHNALSICKRLGVSPKEALMVGDTLADMGMGRSARLGATVGVLSGVAERHELHPHADHLVEDVGEVVPLVLLKNGQSFAQQQRMTC